MNQIVSNTRAEEIRDNFNRIAAENRATADRFEAEGDHINATALRAAADSQERMAAKRYEAMTITARI